MKKFIFNEKKEIINFKKKTNILEFLLIIIMCIITYEYDKDLSTVTLLYTFPLLVMIFSLEYLVILNKYKKLDNKYWIPSIILSLLLMIIPTYIVISKNINPNLFLILLGSAIIVKNIIEYLIYQNRRFSLIKNIILVIIGILFIVFNTYIINNLILIFDYIIILFVVIAVLKLIYYFLSKKFSD